MSRPYSFFVDSVLNVAIDDPVRSTRSRFVQDAFHPPGDETYTPLTDSRSCRVELKSDLVVGRILREKSTFRDLGVSICAPV